MRTIRQRCLFLIIDKRLETFYVPDSAVNLKLPNFWISQHENITKTEAIKIFAGLPYLQCIDFTRAAAMPFQVLEPADISGFCPVRINVPFIIPRFRGPSYEIELRPMVAVCPAILSGVPWLKSVKREPHPQADQLSGVWQELDTLIGTFSQKAEAQRQRRVVA